MSALFERNYPEHCQGTPSGNPVKQYLPRSLGSCTLIVIAVLPPQAGLAGKAGQPIKYNIDLIDNAGHGHAHANGGLVGWWGPGLAAWLCT